MLKRADFGLQLLDRKANEKYLFHGTDAASAEILKTQVHFPAGPPNQHTNLLKQPG